MLEIKLISNLLENENKNKYIQLLDLSFFKNLEDFYFFKEKIYLKNDNYLNISNKKYKIEFIENIYFVIFNKSFYLDLKSYFEKIIKDLERKENLNLKYIKNTLKEENILKYLNLLFKELKNKNNRKILKDLLNKNLLNIKNLLKNEYELLKNKNIEKRNEKVLNFLKRDDYILFSFKEIDSLIFLENFKEITKNLVKNKKIFLKLYKIYVYLYKKIYNHLYKFYVNDDFVKNIITFYKLKKVFFEIINFNYPYLNILNENKKIYLMKFNSSDKKTIYGINRIISELNIKPSSYLYINFKPFLNEFKSNLIYKSLNLLNVYIDKKLFFNFLEEENYSINKFNLENILNEFTDKTIEIKKYEYLNMFENDIFLDIQKYNFSNILNKNYYYYNYILEYIENKNISENNFKYMIKIHIDYKQKKRKYFKDIYFRGNDFLIIEIKIE